MTILYIAYSCSPDLGSEACIGWNIPLESSKTNRVLVITKEEHRASIEAELSTLPKSDIRFFYADIPSVYKKIYSGRFYSGRMNIWHCNALKLARQLCKDEKVDLIHQITPVELRSIGDYGKIAGVRYLCGPIGGGEYIPKGLKSYARRYALFEALRYAANLWHRFMLRASGKLKRCDLLLYANKETKQFLSLKASGGYTDHDIVPEIGLKETDFLPPESCMRSYGSKRVFLVACRLTYRKGLELLLYALSSLPKDADYTCRIAGSGPEEQRLRSLCSQLKLDNHVVFLGHIPYAELQKEYEQAEVFLQPSLRETTGTVILEAAARGIPVVTPGRFGAVNLLNDEIAWLYNGSRKEEYIQSLRSALLECIHHPQLVRLKGELAAKEASRYLWSRKVTDYQQLYAHILAQKNHR